MAEDAYRRLLAAGANIAGGSKLIRERAQSHAWNGATITPMTPAQAAALKRCQSVTLVRARKS